MTVMTEKFAYYCLALSSPHASQFFGFQSAAQWKFLEGETPSCPSLDITVTKEKKGSSCSTHLGNRHSPPWMR